MPHDKGLMTEALEDDAPKKSGKGEGTKRRFDEFECPGCTAHNPVEGIGNGDEVNCSWCGMAWLALVDDEGRLKLKEA